ncbi:MAG: methyltransferase [Bacteroides sp.]|nr:methyltransferase [Bacteroides sp.]MCM1379679.1 methyltransferase [Bacteroides sp.]MCM1446034.1 methyltransferase [Prevotella sp.]
MREKVFRFKEFSVCHERAAMKVGTDGVSLGAMAPVSRRVLDIGCGCGLIGLMMAQRGASEVVMLDIDPEAAAEAADNAAASPWTDRVSAVCADILNFTTQEPFDSIVCNPPFFASGLLAPDPRRAAARHEDSLPPQPFMHKASALLSLPSAHCPLPTLSLILPPNRLGHWVYAAKLAGLHLVESIELTTKPSAPPRRVIAIFSHCAAAPQRRQLALNSTEYKAITSPFYLNT